VWKKGQVQAERIFEGYYGSRINFAEQFSKPTVISYDLMVIMWESTTAQMMFVLKKKILTHYPTIQITPQLKFWIA